MKNSHIKDCWNWNSFSVVSDVKNEKRNKISKDGVNVISVISISSDDGYQKL